MPTVLTTLTSMGFSILETFIAEADHRPPHCAIDRVLGMAERLERDQGGRLTEFQVRTFAALLLGAQRHPPDAADPHVVPEWLTPEDAARFEAGAAKRPDARTSSALTSH